MPVYDFNCERCGSFSVMRSMAARDRPCQCPECGEAVSRIVSAPALALMAGSQRNAHATNERASHAPRHSSDMPARHRSGCACCSGSKLSLAGASGATNPNGLKSPSGNARPWMISH